MKKLNLKRVCALTLSAVLLFGITACGNKANTGTSATPTAQTSETPTPAATPTATPEDLTKITGKVVFATEDWSDIEGEKKLVAEFNKIYPNVQVEVLPYSGDRVDYLTAQAAAKTMPDVIRSYWYQLPPEVGQGWVYPLNEFIEKDSEFQYVTKQLYESYNYNGRVYGLPMYVGFHTLVLNLDMLESMNEDVPSYDDWTVEEFTRLVKKATTNTTSGISNLGNFDYFLPMQLDPNLADGGYNDATHKIDITSGAWIQSVNLVKELKAIPGLVSDDLWNQELRDAGKVDDYEKKFGKDADAVRDGKVLVIRGSTWDYGWLKTLPFKWDFYPLPSNDKVGFRNQTHSDMAMMLATAKDPRAAFEWLKFLTYGKDGNLARLNRDLNAVDAEGKPAPNFFIPATTHPDVVKAMDEIAFLPDGIRYMYKNIDKSMRGDHYRFVPNFDQITSVLYGDERKKVYDGTMEAAALAAELETKINDQLKTEYDAFMAKLPAVEAEFDANHPKK